MVRTPLHEHNQEATEILKALGQKLDCSTDEELSEELSKYLPSNDSPIQRNQFSKWRAKGLPKNIKALLLYILKN